MKSYEIGRNKTALQKEEFDSFIVIRSQDNTAYWAARFDNYTDANAFWETFV